MRNILVVVDMQKDFIDGALGTPEAVGILPTVKALCDCFEGEKIFTRDTHGEDYLSGREGRLLPVPHCIKGTEGHAISPELSTDGALIIDKPTFGSVELQSYIISENEKERIDEITLIGLCTDICVISNAMLLKAALPECEISVVADACAGVTPQSHENALSAMKMCQITVYESAFEFTGVKVMRKYDAAFRELAKH